MSHFATAKLNGLWEVVTRYCNTVLDQAHVYGFHLMDLPDPDVRKITDALTFGVLPILDKLITEHDLDHDGGRLLINIKNVTLILRDIVKALDADNSAEFSKAISELQKQVIL